MNGQQTMNTHILPITREEFCEICKSEGLEVICEETGYSPHSIHATAYITSPVLSKERDSFADWDYDQDFPHELPWISSYDALLKERSGLYHVSTSDFSDCPIVIDTREELRTVCHNVIAEIHHIEEDPTYRPEHPAIHKK